MQFQLITPEKIYFEGPAQMVTIPGSQGEFGVLPGHAPFVATLRPGVVSIAQAEGARRVVVLSGLAEVTAGHCVVLAETAEDCTDITPAQAQARLAKARAANEEAVTEQEKKQATYELAVAEALVAA